MRFTTTQKIFIAREIKSEINKIFKKTITPPTDRERQILVAMADAIINLPSDIE
jgi:hypothetical protein